MIRVHPGGSLRFDPDPGDGASVNPWSSDDVTPASAAASGGEGGAAEAPSSVGDGACGGGAAEAPSSVGDGCARRSALHLEQ